MQTQTIISRFAVLPGFDATMLGRTTKAMFFLKYNRFESDNLPKRALHIRKFACTGSLSSAFCRNVVSCSKTLKHMATTSLVWRGRMTPSFLRRDAAKKASDSRLKLSNNSDRRESKSGPFIVSDSSRATASAKSEGK